MKILFTTFLLVTTLSLFAQTSKEYLQMGIDKHNEQDYNGAIKDYSKAIKEDKQNKDT